MSSPVPSAQSEEVRARLSQQPAAVRERVVAQAQARVAVKSYPPRRTESENSKHTKAAGKLDSH